MLLRAVRVYYDPFLEDDDAMPKVNLDALIPHLDMEGGEVRDGYDKPIFELSHTDLEFANNTYQLLRKPDFQRPTSAWTPQKVRDLIVAYAKEGLVPAIILWRSPNKDLFVIDGAHRLSSLIAWIQDDYGDGDRSKKFFSFITEQQKDAADETRDLVNKAVGPWDRISKAIHATDQEYESIARSLSVSKLMVQMLPTTT